MYAQKISLEKEKLWETPIYTGGFTSGHFPWTSFSVISDTEGGIFAGWFDDRYNSNFEKTYISHILSDGEQGFVTSSDEEGLRLNLNPYMRSFAPDLCYDPVGEYLYVAWEEHTSGQFYRSTVLQKVSKEGELFWDNPQLEGDDINGLALEVSDSSSLQLAGEGKIALFYPGGGGYAVSLFDVSGEQPQYVLWPSEQFVYSSQGVKSGLSVVPLNDNESFLACWTDYRTGSSAGQTGAAFAQRVLLPSISSAPLSLDFGEVVLGETQTATVTVTNSAAPLTAAAFSLAQAEVDNFAVVSVTQAAAEAGAVEVTLSFTPSEAQEYMDTLVVSAGNAEVYRIPLSGTGKDDVAIRNTQATKPQVSVRKGEVVLSQAAVLRCTTCTDKW
jgi:hypothetical protein